MGRTEQVELTTLCLIHKGDRYLLQDRIKEDWKGCRGAYCHKDPDKDYPGGIGCSARVPECGTAVWQQ